jgi:acid stress-induced BolA-like protein IbaG/YrbA
MTTGMKVLPSEDSDSDFLPSPAGLKLTRVPPPSLSLRPDPMRPSSLSFYQQVSLTVHMNIITVSSRANCATRLQRKQAINKHLMTSIGPGNPGAVAASAARRTPSTERAQSKAT